MNNDSLDISSDSEYNPFEIIDLTTDEVLEPSTSSDSYDYEDSFISDGLDEEEEMYERYYNFDSSDSGGPFETQAERDRYSSFHTLAELYPEIYQVQDRERVEEERREAVTQGCFETVTDYF